MKRYICIHGHFYQPSRENAWLEEIEVQDSAYPFHDWNERISRECYAPNTAARILDGESRIVDIINNYSRISFNFGPTLLSWLEKSDPETYKAVLQADRESRKRFAGHGSAPAQVYNHMIMPLANERLLRITEIIEKLEQLNLECDYWEAQNIFFFMLKQIHPEMKKKADKGDEKAGQWLASFRTLGHSLKVKVDE